MDVQHQLLSITRDQRRISIRDIKADVMLVELFDVKNFYKTFYFLMVSYMTFKLDFCKKIFHSTYDLKVLWKQWTFYCFWACQGISNKFPNSFTFKRAVSDQEWVFGLDSMEFILEKYQFWA